MIEPIFLIVGIFGGWLVGLLVGVAIRDHEYNRIGIKHGGHWTIDKVTRECVKR